MRTPRPAAVEWCITLAALALPTLVTWLYFVVFAGHRWMQVFYGGGKTIQFLLPVVYLLFIQRRPPRFTGPDRRGLVWGALFGMSAVAAMLALYYGGVKHGSLLAGAPEVIVEKLQGMAIDSPLTYLGMAVFYALLHSLLEEYYWRWFVFGRLRDLVPLTPAIVLSSLGFMAHHVLVLGAFLHGFGLATWFFSLCIAVGGAFWAWLYDRTGALYGPWVGHLLIDAGIMWVGYDLAFL